ncbi:MAG: hypothetical protein ETSY2_09605 [Candidatus Entotheonella gemina]|uniref:Pvc16 N-terminal domain-containing protein n=1 Tax=Candidatus Entotheonella gemina TaxID=1429439 RepID=W4MBZ8_9BACT|nr:MAG: hypothetical protein ETSY2_09605 [Candidatus Entotheonella gemina]
MFQDLDATLAALIASELSLPNVAVSFATPDDQFPPSGVSLPAVDLFLYDVQENLELRRAEWIVEQHDDGAASRRRPPVHVNCSYLVTAWPSDSSPNPSQDEHRLLGEVMKVLLRHSRLPDNMLQGELAGQEPPLRAKVLRESHLQSLGEFWQAMGGKPKPTLHYTVTISVDISTPEELGVVVSEKVTTLGPMAR